LKRVGFLLKVREECIEQYKKYHADVWDSQNAVLKKHGWNNFSLFIRPDGLLFGYVETPESFHASLAGLDTERVNTEWQELMAPLFEIAEGERPDTSMIELEEIYHLD
tara:strand:- start:8811 stop:9134 length:324 start_codon:yes stop_codon:yes gene_type:complete